jgi:hypothetical protein
MVAGGGFVPQSLTDSSELADSTMVRNAEKGYKGMSFIQFSFSSARFALQHGGEFTKQFARPTTRRDLFCRLFKN